MRAEQRAGWTAPGIPGGRSVVWLFALVIGIAVWPSGAHAQFAVHPVQIEARASSGLSTRTLTVENRGTEVLTATVYLSDYERVESGGHDYMAFGDHPNSCEGRLEAFPDQLSVEPGERAEVRVRIQPGSEACWGMVFVEKRTPMPSGLVMAQRIGVKVLAEPDEGALEGQVLGLAADTTAEPAALLAFQNEGARTLDVDGEVEIRDMTGEVVGVVEMESFRVLPERRRRVRVPLSTVDLEPGRYLMVAILDFGGEYLAGGQALFEVEP